MTRHVFKLVWNRKRSTGLILVELLICFLVLCGIMTSAVNLTARYRQPLGFDYGDVWGVSIEGMNWRAEGDELAANRQAVAELMRLVRSLPDVEAAAVTTNRPYSGSTWTDDTWIDGRRVRVLRTLASPDLREVLKLQLLSGRWIDDTDSGLGYRPVVITHNLARGLFGYDDPLGKDLPIFDREGQLTTPEGDAEIRRVVGVLAEYRRNGEFRETDHALFVAVDPTAGESLPSDLVVRVRPGTTAAFEEALVRAMLEVAPQWSYDSTLLETARFRRHREYLFPILVSCVVAVSLIAMVGLGLVGVLWLSVTRRTSELGLRRAMGASAVAVRGQILGELWALTTMAVAVGTVIFLQLPLFGANFGAGWPVFLTGLTAATAIIYAFVTFCGLYPTWLATRVQPAVALQYE